VAKTEEVKMKQIFEYIKSVRLEWFKIVWPSRDAVIRATIMIFIFAGLLSLFLFFIDSILNQLVGLIF
jgi:preprotein translocase subunit SecE